jgi:ribonuclease-3
MDRLEWAESYLGYRFHDPELLTRALTHRSVSKSNNERLEFLGDAFLSHSVARRLYESRPAASEGDLSRLRAYLVKGSTLAAIGREIGLEKVVIVGPGELRSGGARRSSVLANSLEALLGAVVLDGGESAAEASVERLFASRLESLPSASSLKDSKTRLQEWLQGRGFGLPSYVVESSVGAPHEQTFTVVCTVAEQGLACRGLGTSRRKAEQAAAEAALGELSENGE